MITLCIGMAQTTGYQCNPIPVLSSNGKLANCSSFSEDLCSNEAKTTLANTESTNSSSLTYTNVNYTVKLTGTLKQSLWVILSFAGGIALLLFILFVHVVLSLFCYKVSIFYFVNFKLNLNLYIFCLERRKFKQ